MLRMTDELSMITTSCPYLCLKQLKANGHMSTKQRWKSCCINMEIQIKRKPWNSNEIHSKWTRLRTTKSSTVPPTNYAPLIEPVRTSPITSQKVQIQMIINLISLRRFNSNSKSEPFESTSLSLSIRSIMNYELVMALIIDCMSISETWSD